jgi:hypothetical protein
MSEYDIYATHQEEDDDQLTQLPNFSSYNLTPELHLDTIGLNDRKILSLNTSPNTLNALSHSFGNHTLQTPATGDTYDSSYDMLSAMPQSAMFEQDDGLYSAWLEQQTSTDQMENYGAIQDPNQAMVQVQPSILEQRRARRRARNRLYAKECRARKKQHVGAVEQELQDAQDEIAQLRQELANWKQLAQNSNEVMQTNRRTEGAAI